MSNRPNSHSKAAGFTGASFEPPPTVDFVISDALNTNTDADFDITGKTLIKSFKTKFDTADTFAGVTSVKNIRTDNTQVGTGNNEPSKLDSIRNYWGFMGSEIEGGDSLLGLDVSDGLDNAITLDAFFGTTLNKDGAPGPSNDVFITELFGDDSIVMFPLDKKGKPIRDFQLEINTGPGNSLFDDKDNFAPNINDTGDWGDSGTDLALSIDFTSGSLFDDINLVGAAFDISDFEGTGVLNNVAGLRIQGTSKNSDSGSFDPGVIGYNLLAANDIASPIVL